MPKTGEPEFNWKAPCLAEIGQMDGVYRHELHDEKIMASYIYGWIGKNGRDDLAGIYGKRMRFGSLVRHK